MFTMIQTHGKVICYSSKLGITAAIRSSKAMLMITEDIVMVNVKKYKGVY